MVDFSSEFAIFKFYGTDWAAMFFTFLQLYLLGNKNPLGFGFGLLANICWTAFGLLAGSIANPLASRAGHSTAQATMSETATQAKVRQGGRRSRNRGEDRMARLMKAAKIVARMTAGTAIQNSKRTRFSASGGADGGALAIMTASNVIGAPPTLPFCPELSMPS